MSFHRATLVALATLFTVGMTSLASAGCCDGGYSASFNFGSPATAYYVLAPVTGGGCGGCGMPTAAAIYAQPVAPAPIAVSSGCCGPAYSGCGGCGSSNAYWGGSWGNSGCGGCGGSAAYGASPLYVVNQGPAYTGPGLTVPYSTYAPEAAYAPATDYPYASGYGYGAPSYGASAYSHYYARPYRPRYAYRGPVYPMPRYYAPMRRWHGGYWHRPLGVRG